MICENIRRNSSSGKKISVSDQFVVLPRSFDCLRGCNETRDIDYSPRRYGYLRDEHRQGNQPTEENEGESMGNDLSLGRRSGRRCRPSCRGTPSAVHKSEMIQSSRIISRASCRESLPRSAAPPPRRSLSPAIYFFPRLTWRLGGFRPRQPLLKKSDDQPSQPVHPSEPVTYSDQSYVTWTNRMTLQENGYNRLSSHYLY